MGKVRSEDQKTRPGQLSLQLPEPLLEQVKGLAKVANCSIADVVRRGLTVWLVSDDAKAMLQAAEESLLVGRRISEAVTNASKK